VTREIAERPRVRARFALALALLVMGCAARERPMPMRTPPTAPVALAAPAPDDLTAALEEVRAARGLPAVGAAVWRGGRLVAFGVTGLRKADDPSHPVSAEDRWHLGSDTKAMTATLVGIFVE
jgi:CubicO group peptidase (beta-lactamase class C family)